MYDLPAATRDWFDDDQGMANEDAHNRAAEAGLVGGYADGNGGRKDFRPAVNVSRSDLAVLATRVADGGLVPLWLNPEPCRSGVFVGTFCDDEGTELEAFNEALIATGVEAPWRTVNGHPLFEAMHEVTRGAVVYMLTQAAAIPLDGHPDAFVDDATHDRARWFDAAKAYGIIGGYAGGTQMRPYDPANRDMLAIVLARIYGLPNTDQDFFSDDDGTAVEPYHNRVAAAGLFAGFDDGQGGRRFRGALQANRADVAVLQARAVAAGLHPIWQSPAP